MQDESVSNFCEISLVRIREELRFTEKRTLDESSYTSILGDIRLWVIYQLGHIPPEQKMLKGHIGVP